MKKLKVTLICPKWEDRGLVTTNLWKMPSQSSIQLASLTPLDWEVEIIDENFATINYDKPTDLVALTANTAIAPRAYEIAGEYTKRGVPTVMGGIHASYLPDEAAKHVCSVVIGEADKIWPTILYDFKKNSLKKIYRAERPTNLDFTLYRSASNLFPIRLSHYSPFPSQTAFIQTQRGCPINCDFCSVTDFNGRYVRSQSISYTLQQISRINQTPLDYLIFTNDNIVAIKSYAKSLFRALIPLNLSWASQADIRIADDDILDLACQSGFFATFIGLDAIVPSVLGFAISRIKQRWRPRYEEAIKKMHDRGVVIIASFMFGADNEDPEIIQATVEWAIENKIDQAQFRILTPLPGTKLFRKMSEQGRITTRDWARYHTFELVFRSKHWEKGELEQELRNAYRRFYSFPSIIKRLHRLPLKLFINSIGTNLDFRHFKP